MHSSKRDKTSSKDAIAIIREITKDEEDEQ